MQTLVDQPGFTIHQDPTTRWLHVTWQGHHTAPVLKHCFELLLGQVQRLGSAKILNDCSQDLDGWGQAVRWAQQEFFPRLVAAGVVAWAWVIPQDLRAHIDVNKVLEVSPQLLLDTFSDVEAACRWLHTLPPAP